MSKEVNSPNEARWHNVTWEPATKCKATVSCFLRSESVVVLFGNLERFKELTNHSGFTLGYCLSGVIEPPHLIGTDYLVPQGCLLNECKLVW